eukprot:1108058-Prymnesium_polylepis.1
MSTSSRETHCARGPSACATLARHACARRTGGRQACASHPAPPRQSPADAVPAPGPTHEPNEQAAPCVAKIAVKALSPHRDTPTHSTAPAPSCSPARLRERPAPGCAVQPTW